MKKLFQLIILVSSFLAIAQTVSAQEFIRIENRWKPDEQIHNQTGVVTSSATQPGWYSAQWLTEPVSGGKYFRLKNRWKGIYLHNQNGKLELGSIEPGWHSAMWVFEKIPGSDYYRVQNRWSKEYLHNQLGELALGSVEPGWYSAQWKLLGFSGAAAAQPKPTIVSGTATVSTPAPSKPSVALADASIKQNCPDGSTVATGATCPVQNQPSAVATNPPTSAPPSRATGCPGNAQPYELNGQMVCPNSVKVTLDETVLPAFIIDEGAPDPIQYFTDLAANRCADPGNLMLDGWNKPERLVLETAAREMFKKKGLPDNQAEMQRLISRLKTDATFRWEFAPEMIESAFAALTAKDATPGQTAFRDRFEKWAGCDKNLSARRTLSGWYQHLGRHDHGVNIGGQASVQWLDPNPNYVYADLSLAAKKGPSVYGFDVTNGGNPHYIGHAGKVALGTLIAPLEAQATPELNDFGDLIYIREEFSGVAKGVAAGSGVLFGGILGVAVPGIDVRVRYKNIKFTERTQAEIKARDLENAQRQADKAKNQANKGLKNTKSSTKAANASKKVGKTAGKNSKSILRQAIQKTFRRLPPKAGAKVSKKIGSKIGTKIAAKLTSKISATATGVAMVVVIGAVIYGEELAEIIQTKLFEEALIYDATHLGPYNVAEALGSNPGPIENLAVYSLLLKMIIAEPADRNVLELALPTFECPIGFSIEGDTCTVPVRFHSQDSISLAEAKQLADQNGWRLATADEIKLAWGTGSLDVYAFGMMADGKFAVPVQRDFPNFKTGANIGATGGNQGFFYVTDFIKEKYSAAGETFIQSAKDLNSFITAADAKPFHEMDKASATWNVIEKDGYVLIRSKANPNNYFYAESGTLVIGAIDPNSKKARWKMDSNDGRLFWLESVAFPHQFIHNEKGRIELGYIEPNWKGSLWNIPGF